MVLGLKNDEKCLYFYFFYTQSELNINALYVNDLLIRESKAHIDRVTGVQKSPLHERNDQVLEMIGVEVKRNRDTSAPLRYEKLCVDK